MSMTKQDKQNIIQSALEANGTSRLIKRSDLWDHVHAHGFDHLTNNFLSKHRVDHGIYDLHSMAESLNLNPAQNAQAAVSAGSQGEPDYSPQSVFETTGNAAAAYEQSIMASTEANLIPEKDSLFVKTPNYRLIEKVVKSGEFYPLFITGMSGNGKSLSVIQACANTKRELLRINVTQSTDEDDLIGSFRLFNGETVWQDGPVIEAMKRGAVLLIDEIDMLNPNKAAALFTALEGRGVFLKKINTLVHPTDGFNIIATANTKGKGSDDGRFMGTNILNEAFLERFPITFEFEYPTKNQETKIMKQVFSDLELDDEEFATALIDWAHIIRKSFEEGAVDEIISTRRLVHIAKAYSIFNKKDKAIKMCIARFDDETKEAFYDLYTKIDAKVITTDEEGNQINVQEQQENSQEQSQNSQQQTASDQPPF